MPATNIGLEIWRLKSFYQTFPATAGQVVQGSTLGILLNFYNKNTPFNNINFYASFIEKAMKIRTNKIILAFFLFFSISCSRKGEDNTIRYFEFSFNDTFNTCYTLVYKPNDSLYIREHWNASDIFDSLAVPKGKTNYSAKINPSDEENLIRLVSQLNLRKLNDEYYENFSDGTTYAIFVDKDSINKLITVHSDKPPKELDSLAIWTHQLKENLKLNRTEKKFKFKSSKFVVPPPPPPPPLGAKNQALSDTKKKQT